MSGLEEYIPRQAHAAQARVEWDKQDVSSLLDTAHDYIELGNMDLAQQFVTEARRYDNGTYRQRIEGAELHLEISRAFAEYDCEQAQKQEYTV